MEDYALLLTRLHELESELQAIKAKLIKPKKPNTVDRYLRRPWDWVLNNWGFCFFVLGLCFAVWTYARYGVGYFESQKSTWLRRESSESYRRLGDKLILYGEFKAAKDAYSRALKINDGNIEATRGLLKTEVLEPLEGQNYVIPEIAQTRIDHLREMMKTEEESGLAGFLGWRTKTIEKEGYLVDFFEGLLHQDQNESDQAKVSYRHSFEKNPQFIYGYIAHAMLDYENHNYDSAITTLEAARNQDPNSAYVLDVLGACYMFKKEFQKAAGYFSESLRISSTLSNSLELSEAKRYLMEAADATQLDEATLELVSDTKNEKERFLENDLIFGFLPENKDEAAPNENQTLRTLDEKKMAVYYALALDHALNQGFERANESFTKAALLDPGKKYNSYVRNRIVSLEHLSIKELPATTQDWMNKKVLLLSSTR
jgi:tetratricopeptide (TPR) repeat protein